MVPVQIACSASRDVEYQILLLNHFIVEKKDINVNDPRTVFYFSFAAKTFLYLQNGLQQISRR